MCGHQPHELLARNRRWATRKTTHDPDFFHRLRDQQRLHYFWIGCSDCRVPATEIVDVDPGAIFVHRNVANLTVHGDPSFEAALAYAVDTLQVRHIIVTGHYGCGGVRAAASAEDACVAKWLSPIRELNTRHSQYLTHLTEDARQRALCELNVLDQTEHLRRHPVLTRVRDRSIHLHSWIYDISHGVIAPLNAAQKLGV